MKSVETLIDINKRKGLPRVYRFNQFIRWFTMFLGTAAIVYSIWVMINKIDADTSKFIKIAPIIILVLAASSLLRNLVSLNSILFRTDMIVFRFLARKKVAITWNSLRRMSLEEGKHKGIQLVSVVDEKEKEFSFTMAFPHMLEIVNSIAEMAPQLEYDEFMEKVIVSEKEREQARKTMAESSESEEAN